MEFLIGLIFMIGASSPLLFLMALCAIGSALPRESTTSVDAVLAASTDLVRAAAVRQESLWLWFGVGGRFEPRASRDDGFELWESRGGEDLVGLAVEDDRRGPVVVRRMPPKPSVTERWEIAFAPCAGAPAAAEATKVVVSRIAMARSPVYRAAARLFFDPRKESARCLAGLAAQVGAGSSGVPAGTDAAAAAQSRT
jgi:hypothetical protein